MDACTLNPLVNSVVWIIFCAAFTSFFEVSHLNICLYQHMVRKLECARVMLNTAGRVSGQYEIDAGLLQSFLVCISGGGARLESI